MVSRGASPGMNSKPFPANCSPKPLSRGAGEWHAAHPTPYFREKAGDLGSGVEREQCEGRSHEHGDEEQAIGSASGHISRLPSRPQPVESREARIGKCPEHQPAWRVRGIVLQACFAQGGGAVV
jgi:hypothetical protein